MNDRRNPHPRYPVSQPVSLLLGNNGCRVFCGLKDMSLLGARLTAVPLRYVPHTFRILINSEDLAVPCRLRWMDGADLGVQFTGDPEHIINVAD